MWDALQAGKTAREAGGPDYRRRKLHQEWYLPATEKLAGREQARPEMLPPGPAAG